MTLLFRTTPIALSACLSVGSAAAFADHGRRDSDATALLLGIASSFGISNVVSHLDQDRRSRSRYDRGYNYSIDRDSNRGRLTPSRKHHESNSNRHGFAASFTSAPIRGGSSRRTRIIENPYPGRPISGISFTGIDHDAVHINDVITYPRKRLISHRGYSLSLYHPSPFIGTRGYVDYISVKAKRKEYFTVTFHYD